MLKHYWFIVMISGSCLFFNNMAIASENRCGWLGQNIAPDYWWLSDAKATWIFPLQGDDEVDMDSADKIPMFDDKEFIKTNGSFGYGCACLTVTTDQASKRILRIHKGKQLPLKKCEDDKKLPSMDR
jgi:hypothetical protein